MVGLVVLTEYNSTREEEKNRLSTPKIQPGYFHHCFIEERAGMLEAVNILV